MGGRRTWLAGDLSGDLQGWTPDEYVSLAAARGLDFVALPKGVHPRKASGVLAVAEVTAADLALPSVDAERTRGVGSPTTWAHADGRDSASIVAALRAGRVFTSDRPPGLGGPRLFAEVVDGAVCVCVEDGTGGCLRLVRDNVVVHEAPVTSPLSEHEVRYDGRGTVWLELTDRTGRTTARTAPL